MSRLKDKLIDAMDEKKQLTFTPEEMEEILEKASKKQIKEPPEYDSREEST